jgi:hypothetical protein
MRYCLHNKESLLELQESRLADEGMVGRIPSHRRAIKMEVRELVNGHPLLQMKIIPRTCINASSGMAVGGAGVFVLAVAVSILAKVQHGVVAARILHPQWGANLVSSRA